MSLGSAMHIIYNNWHRHDLFIFILQMTLESINFSRVMDIAIEFATFSNLNSLFAFIVDGDSN
jgi:hypothetical protein